MTDYPYKTVTTYRFTAAGSLWSITDFGVGTSSPPRTYVSVEEVEKNGQEDCHQMGEFCLETGEWYEAMNMEPEERTAILTYVRTNGLPAS